MKRRRPAFTLIELLVVIGIIAVLMALLVPVISKMRIAAQTANVTNQMHRISAAIGNYFNDFQAYPGALANRDFISSASLSAKLGNTSGSFANFATYTQSEDLVMALCGGFQFDSAGKLDLKVKEVGLGPISFNAATSPRKHAYLDRVPAEFPPELPSGAPVFKQIKNWPEQLPGLGYVIDSEAPEFMDLYSSPRPILYLRANPAATGANVVYNSKAGGAYRADFHYDVGPIQAYLKNPTSNPNTPCDFPIPGTTNSYAFSVANLDVSKKVVQDYFTSPGGGTARNAGSYLLLDAGADRIFGTEDDIVIGAGGGQ